MRLQINFLNNLLLPGSITTLSIGTLYHVYSYHTEIQWQINGKKKKKTWACSALGGILVAWFGRKCPLRGTAHYKIKSYSDWSLLLYFEIFLHQWEWSHRINWGVLNHILHNHHRRYWSNVLDSALYCTTILKTAADVFIPPVKFQRLIASKEVLML